MVEILYYFNYRYLSLSMLHSDQLPRLLVLVSAVRGWVGDRDFLSIRPFPPGIRHSELLPTTLVLVSATRGQVGGGNHHIYDLLHRVCCTVNSYQ